LIVGYPNVRPALQHPARIDVFKRVHSPLSARTAGQCHYDFIKCGGGSRAIADVALHILCNLASRFPPDSIAASLDLAYAMNSVSLALQKISFTSAPADAVIRVYDGSWQCLIKTHQHKGEFKEW
jgi:hypothetical protein